MTVIDHLVVLFFALAVPYLAAKSYPQVKHELEKRTPGIREQLYRGASIQQWIILTLILGLCAFNQRDWTELGFKPLSDTPMTWFGVAILVGYASFSLTILNRARRFPRSEQRLRRWIENAPGREVGPTNEREMQWFVWVSLTAGICEEIIYRGYLMWYFASYTDVWTALVVTSIMFGLNHSYQGLRGIVITGAMGFVMGLLFILTDSLLIPILLHAMVDFYSGKMILYANQNRSSN
jgi:membrane protease YdiL (CAAX protease family)